MPSASGWPANAPRARRIDVLLPTIRSDVVFESDQIRDAGFDNFYRMRESNATEENVVPLALFLDISKEHARAIATTEHLFVD